MSRKCYECVSFRDMTALNMGTICLKEVKDNDFQSWSAIDPNSEACDSFIDISTFNPLEWDEKKNQSNIKKHKISFERAIEIFQGERRLSILAKSQEKIDLKDFQEKGIEENTGNLDPYRDEILGLIDNRVYLLVTTFRHSFEQMKYRVISLRPASKEERKKFYDFFTDLDRSEEE